MRARAVEPDLHRPLSRSGTAPGARAAGSCATPSPASASRVMMRISSSRADPAGVEGIVRLRAVGDDRRADLHHLARHVGVVVEAEHDRHVAARGSRGRARPARPRRRRCPRPRRRRGAAAPARRSCPPPSRPVADPLLEEVDSASRVMRPPATAQRADDRHGLDVAGRTLRRPRDGRRSGRRRAASRRSPRPSKMPNAS